MVKSFSTIDAPEFINLQPLELNPLMSECEIKVLYVGENRNHSFISKEVATEMSKTLRGSPIVGYFKEEKEDFADHGQVVSFDDEGIHFSCKTKPYGFVAPDAKVWFQKFEELDDFGETAVREYLMTTGYLWTEQFEESKRVIQEGRPQSMELDENTLSGKWSTNKSGIDFFIINDATFSKLCILGEDVEPCFEGASVDTPKVSKNFSLNKEFKTTLFNMMEDLKNVSTEFKAVEDNKKKEEKPADEPKEKEAEAEDPKKEENTDEKQPAKEPDKKEEEKKTFAKAEDEEKKETPQPEKKEDESQPENQKAEKESDENKEEEDESKKKYSAVAAQLETLQTEYSALEKKYQELVEFKNSVEESKKDELIKSFYMLSDEDKKDVIENKSKYSYDDIEAKLSILCVRKKVNFDLEDTEKKKEEPVMTFNLEDSEASVPAWIQALKDARKSI